MMNCIQTEQLRCEGHYAVQRARRSAVVGIALVAAFFAAVLVAALARPSPAHAAANPTTRALPATLEQAVETAFTRMERVMAPCIARQTGRQQIDVRFIGVPSGDPHVQAALRDELNARFAAAINRISPFVASPAEVSGLIPTLTPGSPLDLKRLKKALDAQVRSPIVAVLELSRPRAAIISVRFRLLGRNDEGVFGCPQQRVLHFAVADLRPRERPAIDLQIRTFAGFWQVTLSQFVGELAKARVVHLALGHSEAQACAGLRQQLMVARSGYFSFRRTLKAARLADVGPLPALTGGAAPAPGGHLLELRLSPHPVAMDVLVADAALRQDGTVLDAALANVVVPRPLDPACFGAERGGPGADAAATAGTAPTDGTPDKQIEKTAEDGAATAGAAPTDKATSEPNVIPEIIDLADKCVGLFAEPDGTCLTPGDAFQECEACPEVLVIPPGTVRVGSPANEPHRTPDEGPRTEIGIALPFAVARHEITRDQFQIFVDHSGHEVGDHCWIWQGAWLKQKGASYIRPGIEQKGDHPAVCVNWLDAQAYVNWLNTGLGLSAQEGYRLPSEAQWEYAARAGAQGRGYDNNLQAAQIARFRVSGNLLAKTTTAPAASKPANAFGLQDMLGNAWEWTQDCWVDTLDDLPKDASPQVFDECPHRTLRGGSWNDRIEHIRLAARSRTEPDTYSNDVGFRVVRPLFLHAAPQ